MYSHAPPGRRLLFTLVAVFAAVALLTVLTAAAEALSPADPYGD